MIKLSRKNIDFAINKKETLLGLKKYEIIQNNLFLDNVEKNEFFQKQFNGYYKIRRNKYWRNIYYNLLEKSKYNDVSFSEVLRILYQRTGNYEASFSSKLIATINTNYPVIDSFVLLNTNLSLPYSKTKDRESKIIQIYFKLINHFEEFKESNNGEYLFDKFKDSFPNSDISFTKMIDLVLWQYRKI